MRAVWAALLVSALWSQGCADSKAAAVPRRVVRLAAAGNPSPFAARLAEEYNRAESSFSVQVAGYAGLGIIDAVERGDADVTLAGADVVYFAYRRASERREQPSHLRAVAALQMVPLHLLVRGDIHDLTALHGRVGGTALTPSVTELVLTAVGLTPDSIQRVTLSAADIASRLSQGTVDAVFMANYYPSPVVQGAVRRGARLLSIDGPAIERLRARYPFVQQVTIPAGTYEGQPLPVHTVGVDLIYVCRDDLGEELVHQLTTQLFNLLPKLSEEFSALRLLNLEQAPATPIPLHEGAARYYREWELFR